MSSKTRVGALIRQGAKTLSGGEAADLIIRQIWEERQGRSGFLSAREQQQIREAVALRSAAEVREYNQRVRTFHVTMGALRIAEGATQKACREIDAVTDLLREYRNYQYLRLQARIMAAEVQEAQAFRCTQASTDEEPSTLSGDEDDFDEQNQPDEQAPDNQQSDALDLSDLISDWNRLRAGWEQQGSCPEEQLGALHDALLYLVQVFVYWQSVLSALLTVLRLGEELMEPVLAWHEQLQDAAADYNAYREDSLRPGKVLFDLPALEIPWLRPTRASLVNFEEQIISTDERGWFTRATRELRFVLEQRE